MSESACHMQCLNLGQIPFGIREGGFRRDETVLGRRVNSGQPFDLLGLPIPPGDGRLEPAQGFFLACERGDDCRGVLQGLDMLRVLTLQIS